MWLPRLRFWVTHPIQLRQLGTRPGTCRRTCSQVRRPGSLSLAERRLKTKGVARLFSCVGSPTQGTNQRKSDVPICNPLASELATERADEAISGCVLQGLARSLQREVARRPRCQAPLRALHTLCCLVLGEKGTGVDLGLPSPFFPGILLFRKP